MFFVVVVVVVDDLGYSNVGTGCVVGVAWVVPAQSGVKAVYLS